MDVKLEVASAKHWQTTVNFSSFWSTNLLKKVFLTLTFFPYAFLVLLTLSFPPQIFYKTLN